MLVLTRKENEKIVIGKNVEITILRVQGPRVRLGITAPADVQVMRGELYQEIECEIEELPTGDSSLPGRAFALSR